MSWIVDSSVSFLQKFCMNVLKCGPIPKHIAIIMDGNRRYATKTKLEKSDGHAKGFEKLAEMLQWCLELGVKEVTVYAFSIENFKRTQEEVDMLMDLAINKFEKLLEEERIMSEGVCIRIIGNIALLPKKLRSLIARAILKTKNNDKAFLNVAFAYTSHDEIVNAIKIAVEQVEQKLIVISDIDELLLSSCLYTNASKNPDLLIRTSGEVRFSDFLLWQISQSYICFTNVLWPEFNIWYLLACIFKYQRSYSELSTKVEDKIPNEIFLRNVQKTRHNILKSYV